MTHVRVASGIIIVVITAVLWAACPAVADESSEITNSIGMKFRLIKAGTFMMGTNDPNVWSFEKPAHQVTLTKNYYMGVHEVTQAQFEEIMGKNPSRYKGIDRPVDSVSCADAIEFCRRLSEKEGVEYRLPYEAEWEYACRAGSTGLYYWGDSPVQADEYEWHKANSQGTTHPVGQKKPNPWGLYDMSGNVQEYCLDYFTDRYFAAPVTDPKGPKQVGRYPLDCTLRGGYFCNHDDNDIRSTHRHGFTRVSRELNPFFGFRIVRVAQ